MCEGGSVSDGFGLWQPRPQSWTVQRDGILARAREERRHVNRQMAEAALKVVRLVAQAGRRLLDTFWWGAIRYLKRRKRLRELYELAAMGDRELRDIGISRNEIRSAIRSGANDISRGHTCRPS